MTRTLAKTLIALGFVSGSVCTYAQVDPPPPTGWEICIDPSNTAPYSPGYLFNTRANDLFRVSVGGAGTVTYGGPSGPCFIPAGTFNVAGRIGFGSGPIGSVQSPMDDDMMYTFGMPISPGGNWSCGWIRTSDPAGAAGNVVSTLFGTSVGNFFSGVSGRYIFIEQTAASVHTQIRTDVVGDGCRVRWQMTNLAATPQQIGVWYGAQLGVLLGDGSDASGAFGPATYTVFPGHKPLLVDGRFKRSANPAIFPPYVEFDFGQTTAYGLHVDLGPTSATSDPNGNGSDATNVDELVVGSSPFVVGSISGTTDETAPPDFIFGDVGISFDQFLIKYEPVSGGSIAPNANRVIFSYFRDTWGNSKYVRNDATGIPVAAQPYSTVVDAPHIIVPDDTGGGTNGLANNPFTIRTYIDNTGGYSNVYVSTQINDVRVKLNLPPGLSIANGDSNEKVITTVAPRGMQAVEWQVVSDGIEVGDLPYSVTVTSIPGPQDNAPITHNGVIRVAATKQIKLEPSANLISAPWVFVDSSWEVVLGLSSPSDFTAYEWDPVQNSYVISTSASRSRGYWIILNPNTHPVTEVDPYIGASTPPDITTGAANIQLKSGWNLIGNPYPYAIPVSQLVGVSAANGGQSFAFADLVSQGVVTPYLAYWDPSVNNYRYAQGITAVLQPNRGYWIKVQTAQDLTLVFPEVFDTFIPGARAAGEPGWNQTLDHWRLQLQARTARGIDVENYLGVALGAQARTLEIPEPPQGPTQDVTLSFDGAIAGQNGRMAQALSNHGGQLEWHMSVKTKNAGPTTVSWPNMGSLPTSLKFRIVNPVTHQSVDMRGTTSITFQAKANSTQEFVIQNVGGGATAPVISTLTAYPGKLSSQTPVTARFNLTTNATITARILDTRGNVVKVLRDQVDLNAGANTAAWDLKNGNGAFVASGTYRFEVLATVDGVTTSKMVGTAVNR